VTGDLPQHARDALAEIVDRDDPEVLGLVLTGSAARGMATEHSDVDVLVVLTDEARLGSETSRSPAIDEIPCTLAELEEVPPWGSDGWGFRWQFAWALVLRDRTRGRIEAAVRRQAVLTSDEVRHLLVEGGRLDGYLNLAYRALKADRDGRVLERRLEAAESVPWWLDVVFALQGRVRPYNKYLAWELREHPLAVTEWSADALVPQVEAILGGDAAAVGAAYAVVEREALAYDARTGETFCRHVIEGWGSELTVLRQASTPKAISHTDQPT
jgi:hypothetical protein